MTDNTVNGQIVHPPRVVRHDALTLISPGPQIKEPLFQTQPMVCLKNMDSGWAMPLHLVAQMATTTKGRDYCPWGLVTTRRHFEELGLNPEKEIYSSRYR